MPKFSSIFFPYLVFLEHSWIIVLWIVYAHSTRVRAKVVLASYRANAETCSQQVGLLDVTKSNLKQQGFILPNFNLLSLAIFFSVAGLAMLGFIIVDDLPFVWSASPQVVCFISGSPRVSLFSRVQRKCSWNCSMNLVPITNLELLNQIVVLELQCSNHCIINKWTRNMGFATLTETFH